VNSEIALIFDMDGVIVDSNSVHTVAWERYLAGFGLAFEDIERRMHGKHNDSIVVDFFGPNQTRPQILEHGAAKERVYRQMMAPQLEDRLVTGIRPFLARHRGQTMAVASNAERLNLEFVLEGAGLAGCFQSIIDASQVSHPKPHPEIYLRSAQALGFAPANCVVFEDSPAGVEAARQAGMRVVGVMTTHQGHLNVDLEIPDFTAPGLEPWLEVQTPR
jgi:beta-phosphoglucomutase family hydrolase